MSSILKVSNLSYQLENGEKLFENISFELNKGEILGILGHNGSGKSTLLKIVLGLIPKQSGEIIWNPGFRNLNIAYLPQHTTFNQYLNLTVTDILDLSSNRDKELRAKLVEEFNLKDISHRLFKILSGGEKQRVLMTMHALNNPSIWFLDEPNKGLDSTGQDQLYQSLKKFSNIHKTPILLIDHNINQTISLCDQILCLNRTGHYHSKKELLDEELVQNLYHCEFEHQKIHQNPDMWGENHHGHHDHSHDECDHNVEKSKGPEGRKND